MSQENPVDELKETDPGGIKVIGDDITKEAAEKIRQEEADQKKKDEKREKKITETITKNMNKLGDALQNTLTEVMTGKDPTIKKKDGDK